MKKIKEKLKIFFENEKVIVYTTAIIFGLIGGVILDLLDFSFHLRIGGIKIWLGEELCK
jgi:hypothetical protein